MSKVGDIKKMYGQDFSILVTNAPSNVINNYTTYSHGPKLLSNILLISTPLENDKDNGYPSMFVTDYNGEPLQLTYSFSFGNGLKLNNGLVSMNIDNNTIKSTSTGLYVNTASLNILGNNKLGIAKVADHITRSDGNLPDETFINSDTNGTLYLSSSFFTWLEDYIQYRINEAIKPLITTNLSGWIEYNNIKYNNGDNISISSNQTNNIQGIYFDFYFKSTNASPESISINNDLDSTYPLFSYPDNLTSSIYQVDTIGDENIYTHKVSGLNILFYPNLNLVLNESYPINYNISIKPESWQESINTFSLKIYQNKLPINIGMSIDRSSQISIHEMVKDIENNSNGNIKFKINNDFSNLFTNYNNNYDSLYDGNIIFSLKIYHKHQNNLIEIYNNDNISNLIYLNTFNVDIPITEDWLNLILNKVSNSNYTEINNKYEANPYISYEYILELTIHIQSTQKVYKSTTMMQYNMNVNHDPKISDINKDRVELVSLNNEDITNNDYTNSFDTVLGSVGDNTSIRILNWEKLGVPSGNNTFVMELKYIVVTSANNTPDSFTITNYSENLLINDNSLIQSRGTSGNEKTFDPITLQYESANRNEILDNFFGGGQLNLTFSSNEFVNVQKSITVQARFDTYILRQNANNEYQALQFWQYVNDINEINHLEIQTDESTDTTYFIYENDKDLYIDIDICEYAYISSLKIDNTLITPTIDNNTYKIDKTSLPSEEDSFILTFEFKLRQDIESDKIVQLSFEFRKQQEQPNNEF